MDICSCKTGCSCSHVLGTNVPPCTDRLIDIGTMLQQIKAEVAAIHDRVDRIVVQHEIIAEKLAIITAFKIASNKKGGGKW